LRSKPPKKIAYAFVAALLGLALLELGSRFFGLGRAPEERLFTDIYDVNYEMLPGALNPWAGVRTFLNKDGFRGDQIPGERTDGVMRIISQGDSTTLGSQVRDDETYTALLDRNLRRRGLSVEILNAGLPGTNLWQQVLFYERRLMDYDADLLILYSTPNFRVDLFAMRRHLEERPWEQPLKRGLARSHLFRFLRRKIKPPTLEGVYSQHVDAFRVSEGDMISREQAEKDTDMDLRHLEKLCRKTGTKLAVIGIVARSPFEQALQKGISADSSEWRSFYGDANIATQVSAVAEKQGIQTIHPEDDFLRAFGREKLFFDAVHFTPAGHRLMAGVLEREICARRLIPQACPAGPE